MVYLLPIIKNQKLNIPIIVTQLTPNVGTVLQQNEILIPNFLHSLVSYLFNYSMHTNFSNKINIKYLKYLINIFLTQGSASLFYLDKVLDAVHIVSKLEFLVQLLNRNCNKFDL